MTANFDLPAPAHFIEEPLEVRERLLNLAIGALSPDFLLQYERLVFDAIDQRYPDNPGSLFNRDHREGKRRKRETRTQFDWLWQQHTQQMGEFALKAQQVVLDSQLEGIAAALHDQQRPLRLQQRMDEVEYRIRMTQAMDGGLQADLARASQSHQHQRELDAWRHDHALATRRLEADIDAARHALDRPQALLLKLHDVFDNLARYQMALLDRANRNPAVGDRLRALAVGLTAVMTNVNGIITQLNTVGAYQPTPDQLREQSMAVLNMAMDQLHQWHDLTKNETID